MLDHFETTLFAVAAVVVAVVTGTIALPLEDAEAAKLEMDEGEVWS